MRANIALGYFDSRIIDLNVGDILEFIDGSKEKIICKYTDKIDCCFLTQIQTVNIKKNGEDGKIYNWMKFKHYTL